MFRCHRCQTPWVSSTKVPGVKETCEQCDAYLHCCLNCRYYDVTKPKQCYIPTTELVSDKAGTNFCDEFEFADEAQQQQAAADRGKGKEAFNALFNESDTEGPKRPGVDDFNKLFGD